MTCWIVVPVKAPGAGKTRLAGVMDAAARQALVARMLGHVVAAAQGVGEVRLIGSSRYGLPGSIVLLDDPGLGLNAALAAALRNATAVGVDRLIFVSADLPLVEPTDIAALAEAAFDIAVIAPDRHGKGTNALSLPLPQAREFRFHYGESSFALHQAEAARLGLAARPLRTVGLGLDIDTPDDLEALRAST